MHSAIQIWHFYTCFHCFRPFWHTKVFVSWMFRPNMSQSPHCYAWGPTLEGQGLDKFDNAIVSYSWYMVFHADHVISDAVNDKLLIIDNCSNCRKANSHFKVVWWQMDANRTFPLKMLRLVEDELFGDQWCLWELLQNATSSFPVCPPGSLSWSKVFLVSRSELRGWQKPGNLPGPYCAQSINRVAVVLQQTQISNVLWFFHDQRLIYVWSISTIPTKPYRTHMCEWVPLGKSRKSVWLFENVVLQVL